MGKKAKLIKKIITFIGSFLAALSVVAQFFPDAFSFLTAIPDANRLVFVGVVVMLLGLFFINWKQSIDEHNEKMVVQNEMMHAYAHLLRDTTYEIDKLSGGQNNDAAINHLLVTFTNGVVNCVKDNFCALWGSDGAKNEISVSVKVLEYKAWDNSKITDKDATLYKTMSRSYTPKGALQADDAVAHPISACSAFHSVFTEGKHDWSGFSLSSKNNVEIISEDVVSRGVEHLDSCQNFGEYFNNRIVVPIRVKLSEIDDNYANSDERNLFGFLCIEYKRDNLFKTTDKFDEELISVLDLMKTYADTMYPVYDKAFKNMSYSQG